MTDIREKNKRPKFRLSYPDDLGHPDADYPYMTFDIVSYPPMIDYSHFEEIKDTESSKIKDPNQSALTRATKDIARNTEALGKALVIRDGVTDPDGGRILTTIQLPITNSVTNSLGIDWSMNNEGALLNTLAQNAKNYAMSGDMSSALVDTVAQTTELLGQRFLNDLFQRFGNRTFNPKKQALFSGVEPRMFVFDFIFTPTSEAEAKMVQEIIQTFTKYSLPKLGTNTLYFNFPYSFKISFHGVQGFPRINACVCTQIQTNYTPNTLQLLKSGHAVQIAMAMQFLETTVRTEDTPGVF